MAKGYKVATSQPTLDPFKNSMKLKPTPGYGIKRATIREKFESMKSGRVEFLERAKRYSKMTIPALFNENEGNAPGSYNQNGWQSLGAQCVNHLSNRLVMTWFPPQRSFFRMTFTDEAKQALYEAGVKDVDLQKIMSRAEEKARVLHEEIQGRIAWTQAAKHLIVAGNACLYVPEDGPVICYPMDRYVVKRSKGGKLLHLIVEEEKSLSEFPEDIQAYIKVKKMGSIKADDVVKLYTESKFRDGKFTIRQEVCDVLVGKVFKVLPEDNPFIALTWDRLYGESYGRGLVEINAGDLFVYGFLSKALAQGAALMSDVKYLVRRGSATSPEEHAKAETGDYIWGEEGDITVVQLQKYADFQTVSEVLNTYSQRLGQAFLLLSSVRRDAERVTAYELRLDAQELETSLGGTYSQIAVSGQLPYASILLKKINFELPSTEAVPTIITGIESLGKAAELDKIMQFSEMMQVPNTWPEEARGRVIWSDYMTAIAANIGMENPWIMDEQAYAAKQAALMEQQQQAELLKAAPQLTKGM
ncbi:head-tail connector protein [Aeromonas phage vB_AspA_Tola]|nr:head-tail connector protein [Aeromonas phage vB_AspA_Tola]